MNDYRAYVECDYNSIYHHGIKGQHWGVRRFQNEDGSLTLAGEERYLKGYNTRRMDDDSRFKVSKKIANYMDRMTRKHYKIRQQNSRLHLDAIKKAESEGKEKLSKEDDLKFEKLYAIADANRAKELKEFVRKFEEDNNVKVCRYQDLHASNQMVYTDGKKYYSISKSGADGFNFNDVTAEASRLAKNPYGRYFFNVNNGTTTDWEECINDGKKYIKDWTT